MTTDFYAPWQLCCGAYNVAEVGCVMDIDELKRLAEGATPGPWHDRCGVLRETNGGVTPIATVYHSFNSQFIAAANPAAILELIRQMEGLEYAAEANKTLLLESRQNDYQAMAWLAECRFAVGDDGKRMLPEFVEHLKSLNRQRDELLAALKEARELVDDWGAYAPAYMQEKHDLQGDLDKLDAAITNAEKSQ